MQIKLHREALLVLVLVPSELVADGLNGAKVSVKGSVTPIDLDLRERECSCVVAWIPSFGSCLVFGGDSPEYILDVEVVDR